MYSAELKIPRERVAVLIGKKGTTKKLIERRTRTRIEVTKEGDVYISGEDSIDVFNTSPIVKAIGRGFNPNIALTLLNENHILEIINISDYSKKSNKKFIRIKARLIGTKGKAWKVLEKLTMTDLSVYGKTVSIIGKVEDVIVAKGALEKLLKGAPHGNVYKFIELQK